jgi:hypothetical protein
MNMFVEQFAVLATDGIAPYAIISIKHNKPVKMIAYACSSCGLDIFPAMA